MKLKLLALIAVVALGAAACGTAEDDDGQGNQPEGGGESAELAVTAVDFSFEADGTLPEAGGEVAVSLSNEGDAPHTFSSEEVGLDIEAGPGEQGEGTFTVPDDGTVDFQCNIHTQMTLSLEAGEAATDAGSGGSGSDDEGSGDDGGSTYDYD